MTLGLPRALLSPRLRVSRYWREAVPWRARTRFHQCSFASVKLFRYESVRFSNFCESCSSSEAAVNLSSCSKRSGTHRMIEWRSFFTAFSQR
uniref:Secreted protein n=1 Tax=Panagrellus redivivus TaxID=6233 RepID=A0A7E4VPY5_PANRE